MDGTSQVYHTDAYKASLDPKWNNHYDLYLSRGDGITISVWNQRKLMKKNNGFLGCVRIMSSTIQRLKDTGCKISLIPKKSKINFLFCTDQRLELCKQSPDDPDTIKGQIIVSLMSRDGPSGGNPLAIVGPGGDVQGPSEDDQDINNANGPVATEQTAAPTATGSASATTTTTSTRSPDDSLPAGWEERRTTNGRSYYVNHVTKSTQWERPTVAATLCSPPQTTATSKHDVTLPAAGPSRSTTQSTLSNGDLVDLTTPPPRQTVAAAGSASTTTLALSSSLHETTTTGTGPINKSKDDAS